MRGQLAGLQTKNQVRRRKCTKNKIIVNWPSFISLTPSNWFSGFEFGRGSGGGESATRCLQNTQTVKFEELRREAHEICGVRYCSSCLYCDYSTDGHLLFSPAQVRSLKYTRLWMQNIAISRKIIKQKVAKKPSPPPPQPTRVIRHIKPGHVLQQRRTFGNLSESGVLRSWVNMTIDEWSSLSLPTKR